MTADREWRQLLSDERAILTAVISNLKLPAKQSLLDEVDETLASNSTAWIVDLKSAADVPGAEVPDGPLPVRTYVPNKAAYRGEILVWIKNGRLDGLEYAWVTDDPPKRWPQPAEVEIHPE
ncbi:hypothetical protein A5634_16965 [Mycobacterium asiaticum]|uniref:Uncharacterized protein n=1 Tax=Mycobacterium asiaticum TaxID=1790 RepID=A0A1A3P8G6_MYCAS|nr:hypothetical protein [Mycobacterium asiaticum]OBK29965.1 hypothetical protein A5634_16965 [Mycobacterium asiaticum]